MTDSILRSYYNVSSSMFVPFAAQVEVPSALDLLSGETDGFAIDASRYNTSTGYAYPAFVGGPVGGTVAVIDTGTPANNLSDVPLDGSNLTNSGTSPKMVLFPTSPYVRWAPHNLQIQSQTFTNSEYNVGEIPVLSGTVTDNFTTAPDGTSTAAKIACTVTGDDYFRGSSHGGTFAGYQTVTLYVKKGNTNWIALGAIDSGSSDSVVTYFNINTGTMGSTTLGTGASFTSGSSITDAGGGWYRCSVSAAFNGEKSLHLQFATADLTPGGTAGDFVYVWAAQLNKGVIATPYLKTTSAACIGIPQEYDTTEAKFCILSEPAATNLATASETFTIGGGVWQASGTASVAKNANGPEGGTNTATTVTFGSGAADQIYDQLTVGTNHTVSVFAKTASGTKQFRIKIWDGVGADQFSTNFTATTTWQRFSFTGTGSGAAGNVAIANNSGGTAGDVIVWGFQAEDGTAATSYIPTVGSTVTRAKDQLKATRTSFPFSNTTGSIWLEQKILPRANGSSAFPGLWQVSDGTNSFRMQSFLSTATNLQFYVQDTIQVAGVDETITVSADQKYAVQWATNDFATCVNGGTVHTDASGNIPSTTGDFYFGDNVNDDWPNMRIYTLVYVPRAYSDAELQAKTT